MRRQRIDLLLVSRGFCESRAQAQAAIKAGGVRVHGTVVQKASDSVEIDAALEVTPAHPYVSRGGVKLKAALDHFQIDVKSLTCLDVGASTGGFSDVLLKSGAMHVVAVDVGTNQLHPRLRDDSRLISRENCDIRSLKADDFPFAFDLIVMDVSFIPLHLVLPATLNLLSAQGHMIALIKPQFEVGKAFLKKGIVRDQVLALEACQHVRDLFINAGLFTDEIMTSPLKGGDGNTEYLIHAWRKKSQEAHKDIL
jgi:23S rRNA (cytidine1920-2'-O)/16S rRNA (cytidine1409-2'-O)-methyltransferase